MTKKELQKAVRTYEKGESLKTVSAMLSVSLSTARKHLVEAGATIRPRGRPRKK